MGKIRFKRVAILLFLFPKMSCGDVKLLGIGSLGPTMVSLHITGFVGKEGFPAPISLKGMTRNSKLSPSDQPIKKVHQETLIS